MNPTDKMKELLRKSGSNKFEVSIAATHELAEAFAPVIREGIMSGDIVTDIYSEVSLEPDAVPEFPLDFLAPGTEGDYTAYTINGHGNIPEKHVEGDYVMVPTYMIGNSIDWLRKYARSARWDIVNRALRVMKLGAVKKMNDDGWRVLLSAGVDRNILVYDSDAGAGQFTKRLVTLMKTLMGRNGGGNSSSVNHRILTDLYTSLEAIDDMRNWGVDQVDEVTRRELITREDGMLSRIFSVNLHPLYELGVGQEYQAFFTGVLGASLQASDVELVVGLDLSNEDSFLMPTRGTEEVFEDQLLHRQGRAGFYMEKELSFACLDTRSVILGSF